MIMITPCVINIFNFISLRWTRCYQKNQNRIFWKGTTLPEDLFQNYHDQNKDNDNPSHDQQNHPQVDEVLSKESEQDLLEGDNPGPMTEIKFWEAK